jgi:hypothetical protein
MEAVAQPPMSRKLRAAPCVHAAAASRSRAAGLHAPPLLSLGSAIAYTFARISPVIPVIQRHAGGLLFDHSFW